jgi:DNA repair protein RecN (Recombination protein N)
MLTGLSIRDVVLIERLDLSFGPGLNALTGETGAGKSILLDALAFALGSRGESGLIRQGAAQASVTASFSISGHSLLAALLDEQGHAPADDLILRRVMGSDGRSRAFVNDQPCSIGFLKSVASLLVEMHGQFETGALLDRDTHRQTLDEFGRLEADQARTREAWLGWQAARQALVDAEIGRARAAEEEAFLTEAARQLDELAPKPGEDAELEAQRQRLSHREKIAEALTNAGNEIGGPKGAEASVNAARRWLDRIAAHAGPSLIPAQEALARAAAELEEATQALARVADGDEDDATSLEQVDDRLFALRAAARRHGVETAGLADLHRDIQQRLANLNGGEGMIAQLAKNAATARQAYESAAGKLSAGRIAAAKRLDKAIAAELPPLKLDRARVETRIETLPEDEWSAQGMERVTFLVATNPGSVPGPLNKVASGGELSRFMLALKVVLAGVSAVPVMVFDEVDSGIGGATADAVGERLKRLGGDVQVLAVTHSPQVAARADGQWRVEKRIKGNAVTTDVVRLDAAERTEEIARMLSGATITDEARAAAAKLLNVA